MLLREEIVAAYSIFVIYRKAAASLQSYSHDFVFLCASSMPPPHPTAFLWSFSDFCGVIFQLLPMIHISHFTVHTLKAMKINNSLKLIKSISFTFMYEHWLDFQLLLGKHACDSPSQRGTETEGVRVAKNRA